jgi:hypothetical protein
MILDVSVHDLLGSIAFGSVTRLNIMAEGMVK